MIRGTRIPVAIVEGDLAGGTNFDELEHEYGLTTEGIRAALGFAHERQSEHSFHAPPAAAE